MEMSSSKILGLAVTALAVLGTLYTVATGVETTQAAEIRSAQDAQEREIGELESKVRDIEIQLEYLYEIPPAKRRPDQSRKIDSLERQLNNYEQRLLEIGEST